MLIENCSKQAGGSRRDFNHTNSSDYSSHRHSNRDSSSSHRRTSGARHSSPSPSHRHNSRSNDKGTNERMGPPNRPPQKKFRSTAIKMSGGNNGRDSNRIRKTKMTSAVRSVALRRRVALRQRDTARRVKLARLARRYCIQIEITKWISLFCRHRRRPKSFTFNQTDKLFYFSTSLPLSRIQHN